MFHFPISGVETYWWLPIAVAFGISCFASLGGLSGAFLLLPFQVSVLGFTSPAATPTNLVFNVVAIPSGVYRYTREKRMVWPLALAISGATLPGMLLGAIIRVNYLPQPGKFKLFVGAVLLYIGSRLVRDVFRKGEEFRKSADARFEVENARISLTHISYDFNGAHHSTAILPLAGLCLLVGIIGGTYGIGGGAIIAPFLVTVFRLPVHSIPGASLFATMVSSLAGVLIYTIIAPFYAGSGVAVSPDWLLGAMFGIGGSLGIYLGARIQRLVPARLIKAILAVCLLLVVVKYVSEFISG